MSEEIRVQRCERRGHVRVQDAVALRFLRLHDVPAAGEITALDADILPPTLRVNKYDIDGYAEVKRDYPLVTNYISDLEERIRQLLLDGEAIEAAPTHKVSLSVSGMAFADDKLLHPGQLISVLLTLFPGSKRVGCDARVISAGDAPEIANGDKPTYRVQFLRMSDADRELIMNHVTQLMSSRPLNMD